MKREGSGEAAAPNLRRVLGQRDLILLFIVAVANLNVVPAVAASGPLTVWLWLAALILFFWPQGIAVIELSHRYPGEGGVYLWSKEIFGDFHGFLSGWCYWTNNVFYIPTLLFYIVGISVYVGGARFASLGNNRVFVFILALLLLWVIVWLNVRGLGVGKWVNNIGGIGTVITAAVLVGLAAVHWHLFGLHLRATDFRIAGANWHLISSFGVICFGLVGLELASVMGDEIRDPRRTLPGAVAWGGIASGLLYVGATVEQAYEVMLLLAVVLQLVPFLYLYAALIRIAMQEDLGEAFYKRKTLWLAGISGFATTAIGMVVAFVPPAGRQEPTWLFETKMFVGCAFFIGLAAFFFYVYSRRKNREMVRTGAAESSVGGQSL